MPGVDDRQGTATSRALETEAASLAHAGFNQWAKLWRFQPAGVLEVRSRADV